VTRLALHRPARFLPPAIPNEKLVLPTPPETRDSATAGSWFNILLALLSSLGMAAYMITFGRPLMIIIGIVFFLVAIGTTIGMRVQMRGANQRAGRRQRRRYRAHLGSARSQAREVARAQRQIAAMLHPEPERLWAIVTTFDRVWERRPTDPDFLRVRIGLGRANLATPIQVGNKNDPLAEYDWDSLRAAHRLAARMGKVDGQPSVIDVGGSGVSASSARASEPAHSPGPSSARWPSCMPPTTWVSPST